MLGCKGGAVAGEEAVIGGVAGEDGADIAGKRAAQSGFAYSEAGDGFVEREAHFDWVGNWLDDLIFEGRGAAVPEEGFAPGAVEDARGAAGADLAVDSLGARVFVGK